MQLANPVEIITEPITSIEVLVGEEVLELLSNEDFLKSWDNLYYSCPWASIYQSKEFVATWYRIYQNDYKAILIKATSGDNLTGLLTLAKDENGLIVGAGCGIAEYHVWLTSVSDRDYFIKNALLAITKAFPKTDICFRFLPNGTPLEWIDKNKIWKQRCLLKIYERPLMAIDDTAISQELKKKNRREKINRLKRLGSLKFERITDCQTFSSIFDELATQYDFRKGAMFNKSVFHSPLRKQLLIELFNLGFLHTTILKLNEKIIASHVGAINQSWIHLQGLNTHSPLYARYSPGILHFLMLGKKLAEEGFEIFDLTPGGDSYKETLATKHDSTYELRVICSLKSYVVCSIQNKVYDLVIKNKESLFDKLSLIGLNPRAARKELKLAIRKYNILKEHILQSRKLGLKSLISKTLNSFGLQQKLVTYRLQSIPSTYNDIDINRDNLKDLLKYNPKYGKLSKWEFLSEAMEKFEEESHVYTYSENSHLLFCLWLKTVRTNRIDKKYLKLRNKIPEGVSLLYDIYYHPAEKDRLKVFIVAAVCKSRLANTNEHIYLATDIKDVILNSALKEAGLVEAIETEAKL